MSFGREKYTYIILLIAAFLLGAFNARVNQPLVIHMINKFKTFSILSVCILCALLSLIEWLLFERADKWYRTHITGNSLKEAVDFLPAGVCAYEESGRVVMKNAAMERLSIAMMGESLTNGLRFEQGVKNYPSTERMGKKKVYILPDESVFIFSREQLTVDGSKLTLVSVFDMSEEYAKTQILLQKRKSVQELNARLMEYNREIVSIITSQEVLNAKVKIHDELGAGLLAIRHYLINGGGESEKLEIIDKLNQNIEFLQSETSENRQDEYILMFITANALDVRITIDGELPEEEPNKHIIATAIHECFTNTVRHAKGDVLNIKTLEEDSLTVIFTNNGEQPTDEITEKGGLASLRSMVEMAGGKMRIGIENGFELRISLPKGELVNGI